MKQLPVHSPHLLYLEKSFGQWLSTLGYAEGTIKTLPVHLRELLHYLEQSHQIAKIAEMQPRHLDAFATHLRQRKNRSSGGGLSSSAINKILYAVNTFLHYLRAASRSELHHHLKREPDDYDKRKVLSRAAVQLLYEASYYRSRKHPVAMGQRDRAMLGLFYGCGLRRKEARNLHTGDLYLHKRLLLVRGKGRKERMVPVQENVLDDLRIWLFEGRERFVHRSDQENRDVFLLSARGRKMDGAFDSRLKLLAERAGIDSPVSPHVLRHSIATHLLASGMEIGQIAAFLGHSSLESTQIYTHLSEESHAWI